MIYNHVYWIQVSRLFYVSLSAPLYIFVIFTVIFCRKKEPQLQSSFFHLWVALGTVDLTHAVISWFACKIPLMGFFDLFYLHLGRRIATPAMYFVTLTHFNQVFGIVMLSFNRFTALLYPTKSEPVTY